MTEPTPPAAPDSPPAQHVVIEQRGNIFTRGMRMGVTGCVGCLTFAVIAFVILALAIGACSSGSDDNGDAAPSAIVAAHR